MQAISLCKQTRLNANSLPCLGKNLHNLGASRSLPLDTEEHICLPVWLAVCTRKSLSVRPCSHNPPAPGFLPLTSPGPFTVNWFPA